MERKQKILVTGGGGFLGKAIVKQLVTRGNHVCSFSRQFYPELESLQVLQIQGDIGNKQKVEQALEGIDTVFHVAAKPGVWGDYRDYFRTNVTGTENVISACKKNSVNQLIYTSSPSVVFDGTDMKGVDESAPYAQRFHAHYPKTKAIAEQRVIKAGDEGLKVSILRPHLIWGPGDNHLVPRIIKRAKRLIRVGNGKNLVDTIYIDNAAYAHILAADSLTKNPQLSGKVYFISQDDPVLLWEMINAILKAAGFEPVKKSMPAKAAWLIGFFLELIYKSLNKKKEPPMTRFVANELATSHWFNITAAKSDLGYKPLISTEAGLERLEQWLKK